MATLDSTLRFPAQAVEGRPAGGIRFDLPVAILSAWLVVGTYLDGFVHHNLPGTIESFFTIWHAMLYSGFFAVAAFIVFHQARNMLRGHAWNKALPAGYGLSLLGVPFFIVAGVGDLMWHTIFGFEVGVEALLSPTHLMLATAALMIVSGPLRAALGRAQSGSKPAWADMAPAALSMLLMLSLFTFFTDYTNILAAPFLVIENPAPALSAPVVPNPVAGAFRYNREAQGLAGVFIPSALVVGILLICLRRRALPVGAVTLIVSGNGLMMAGFHYHEMTAYPQALVPLLAGGLMAEVLYGWLRPSLARPVQMALFAFLVPFAMYGLFFAVIVSTAGVWWSIHMWTGAIFLAGAVGLLLSFLALPSPAPEMAA